MTLAPRPIGNEWNPPAAAFGGPPPPPPASGVFVAVSATGVMGDGQEVMTSPDGVTWTLQHTIETYDGAYRDVCYAPELGLLCAVGLNNSVYNNQFGLAAQFITSSDDGVTWTKQMSVEGGNYWSCVEWSPDLGMFVALSPGINSGPDGGGFNLRVAWTSDGVIWSGMSPAERAQWRDICWSPELGIFCAVANSSGTSNQVMTAAEPAAWSFWPAAEPNAWFAVCWSAERGIFVAVAASGVNRVMTSPDGVNWTPRAAAAQSSWLDVCWCASLGLFVAVAADGAVQVMTSPDGINWTARNAASADVWSALAFNGETIVAVAQAGGSGNRVMTSTDGINWTSRASAADKGWVGVCWAGS